MCSLSQFHLRPLAGIWNPEATCHISGRRIIPEPNFVSWRAAAKQHERDSIDASISLAVVPERISSAARPYLTSPSGRYIPRTRDFRGNHRGLRYHRSRRLPGQYLVPNKRCPFCPPCSTGLCCAQAKVYGIANGGSRKRVSARVSRNTHRLCTGRCHSNECGEGPVVVVNGINLCHSCEDRIISCHL